MSKNDRTRKSGKRPQEKRFLVVLEGRVTEQEYVYAAVPRLNKRNVSIKTSRDTGHTDPIGIVNAAKQLRSKAKRTEPYDKREVWCVFDTETKLTQTRREGLKEAVNSAEYAQGNRIELAISNPCFEIWLLWHSENQSAWIASDAVQRRCTEIGLTVGKDGKHIQDAETLVRDHYENAKNRACNSGQLSTSKKDTFDHCCPAIS